MNFSPIYFINDANLKGRTLPEILFRRPNWFFFCYDKSVFDRKGPEIAAEVNFLYDRARRIAIPHDADGKPCQVVYAQFPQAAKLGAVEIVSADIRPDSPRCWAADHIDLSTAYSRFRWDQAGGRRIARLVARLFFPGRGSITRKRCEAFFLDPINFC